MLLNPINKTTTMKKKPGFTMRTICGENFLVAEGLENIDFTKLIALNETSAFLWSSIGEDETFTSERLTELLVEEYDVTPDVARADVEVLVSNMLDMGLIVNN